MHKRRTRALLSVLATGVMLLAVLPGTTSALSYWPGRPQDVTAVELPEGIEVSWSAPDIRVDSVTGYRLVRRSPGEVDWTVVADDLTVLTHLDTTATEAGRIYNYKVKALRGTNVGAKSLRARITRTTQAEPAPEPPAPEEDTTVDPGLGQLRTDTDEEVSPKEPEWTTNQLRPTGLVATASTGFVSLTWDAPEGDADTVDGYEILRRRTNRGENALQTLVADTGTTDTVYVDRTANESDVIYSFRVKALRNGTASRWSNFATATGQANSLEFVGGPTQDEEPELEIGEQHDSATEEAIRTIRGLQFDYDCDAITSTGFRLRITPGYSHRQIVDFDDVGGGFSIDGTTLNYVNHSHSRFYNSQTGSRISAFNIDSDGRIRRQNGTVTSYSVDEGGFIVNRKGCTHLRFKNPIQMSYFEGYLLERYHSPQNESFGWNNEPMRYYEFFDYGLEGNWQTHHVGIPSCGTKSFRVAALYSRGPGVESSYTSYDRGPWSYIEWQNPECDEETAN